MFIKLNKIINNKKILILVIFCLLFVWVLSIDKSTTEKITNKIEEKLIHEKIVKKLKEDSLIKNLKLEDKKNSEDEKKIFEKYSILNISTNFINNNFDQYFEVYWINLNTVDSVLIKCWEDVSEFNIYSSKNNKLITQITKNTLKAWECSIWLSQNWKKDFSKIYLKVEHDNSSISVENIFPLRIVSEQWWEIVFQWRWFYWVIAIQISNWTVLDLDNFKIVNDNVLILKLWKWLDTWEYFFRIMTKDWVVEIKNRKIKII